MQVDTEIARKDGKDTADMLMFGLTPTEIVVEVEVLKVVVLIAVRKSMKVIGEITVQITKIRIGEGKSKAKSVAEVFTEVTMTIREDIIENSLMHATVFLVINCIDIV